MPEPRRERADAVRNRQAILLATEELLTRVRPEEISMEQVAAAAAVGKGTVFHRFGSRLGLMTALMQERALALQELVESGPPPLGPGAEPRERLLAFLDAVVEVVARNKGLLAALGHAVTTASRPRPESADAHPVHQLWHAHISALITADRPDLDADVLADVLLGAFHSDALLLLLGRGEGHRLSAALHAIVTALLGAEPG
jgi:AcrR family transcriptional regulator